MNDLLDSDSAEEYDPSSPAFDPSDITPSGRYRRPNHTSNSAKKARRTLQPKPPLVLPLPPVAPDVALAHQAGHLHTLRQLLRDSQDHNAELNRQLSHKEDIIHRLSAELEAAKAKHSQAQKEVTSLTVARRRLETTLQDVEKQRDRFQQLYHEFKQQYDQAWTLGRAEGYQKATEEVTLRSYHKGLEDARQQHRERNAYFRARRQAGKNLQPATDS